MDPGELDRLLVIYRDQKTGTNTKGGPIFEEVEFARAWAKKLDISDSESIAAQQVSASMTTRFRFYWTVKMAEVDPTFRIRHGGRTYEITGVKEIGTRDVLEFTASSQIDTPKEQL